MPPGPGNTKVWKIWALPLMVRGLFEESGDACGGMNHCEGSTGQMMGQAGSLEFRGPM